LKRRNPISVMLAFMLIMTFFLVVTGCGAGKTGPAPEEKASGRLKIYTTFYPLYDFTKKIAGDKADVENIVPAGVEPHDFEPSPRQIADLGTHGSLGKKGGATAGR